MLGIGCDLADVERIEKAIARKGFKERVFTPEEIARCTGSHGDKVQSYAARFAAKEAVGKALCTGLMSEGVGMQDIEVIKDDRGTPSVKLTGGALAHAEKIGMSSVSISLSHDGGMAGAYCVMLTEK